MVSHSNNIVKVPWDSIDAILRKLHDEGNDEQKRKVNILTRNIMLKGVHKIINNKGQEIYVLHVPRTWYNWIKDLYENPI